MVEMADTSESSAHNLKRILCGVEENASRVCDGKVAKTRRAGSDGDGHIKDEKALAGFGLATNNPDGLVGP